MLDWEPKRGPVRESHVPARKSAPTRAASLVLDSKNAKTGPVAATYASIQSTCPASCPLKGSGCYAQGGRVGMHVARLDAPPAPAPSKPPAMKPTPSIASSIPLDAPYACTCRETLRAMPVPLPSRVPRVRGPAGGGGPVWTYTHAWRDVAASSWSGINVLASCESTADGAKAMERGYAPAVVVPELPANGKAFVRDGVKWIPCLEQTRGKTCVDCRLCWDTEALRARGAGIAFGAHGASKKRVLTVLQGNAS